MTPVAAATSARAPALRPSDLSPADPHRVSAPVSAPPAMSSGPGGRQNPWYQANEEATSMADESVSATTIIDAPAEAIFAVLAYPARHAAIDGTGWVLEALEGKPLTAAGQVFR